MTLAAGLALLFFWPLSTHAQEPACDVPDPPPICNPTTSPPPLPLQPSIGHLDLVATDQKGLRIAGWGINPDSAGIPAVVEIRVDGVLRTTVEANVNRPDVGAAYPNYGDWHGFDVSLLPRRHTDVCVTILNIRSEPGLQLGCLREPRSISILTVNMANLKEDKFVNDNGIGTTTLPWKERYSHLANWIAQEHTLPDVIAFQEFPLMKWDWPFLHRDPDQYEAFEKIIVQIKQKTGANYRISYASVDATRLGLNYLWDGRGLIYNSDRLYNITQAFAHTQHIVGDDISTTGFQARSSWPCSNSPRCSLVDGDGVHWINAHLTPSGQWARGGGAAAVFALKVESSRQSSRPILVINVHQHPGSPSSGDGDANDGPSLRSLIDIAWDHVSHAQPYTAPLVVGDFNGDPENLDDFQQIASHHVDFILQGKSGPRYGNNVMTAETAVVPPGPWDENRTHCGLLANVLSDHCGLFAQFFPMSP